MRVPAAILLTALLTAPLTGLVLHAGTTPAVAQDQQYFWRWSDGDLAKARTFTASRYDSPDDLPRLVVTATPASPQHRVLLQFRDGERWRTDDSAVTSPVGTAALALNPFCSGDHWCRGRFAYRLLVDGRSSALTVSFR
jgi:hypothetical protein